MCNKFLPKYIHHLQKSRTTVNSSIVNNILYAIWYDMLNIANIMKAAAVHQ